MLRELRSEQRAISTVRTLLGHGLDVASPSLDEGLVCDYIVARLISEMILGRSGVLGEVSALRDVAQALLLKGAVLSLWIIFSDERISSEDTHMAESSASEHRAQPTWRARRVQISAPTQAIVAHGVPVKLYGMESILKILWGATFPQKSAPGASVKLGMKYFLTDLFERSKLTPGPEAAEKLSAIESRLQDELRDYGGANALEATTKSNPMDVK